jgi:hypothetical protein
MKRFITHKQASELTGGSEPSSVADGLTLLKRPIFKLKHWLLQNVLLTFQIALFSNLSVLKDE